MRMDPFYAFAAYPTQTLAEQTVLTLVDAEVDSAMERTRAYRQLAMIDFAKATLVWPAKLGVLRVL
ncbi:hypothetical protein Tchar_00316 [Tepidimonas charontis]|uniref:Uncharacterized protein n=1 Tax=Tepidimonas charontis TaxID=2267262 RepID=A0A554XJG0_9BURK|nr:hypothetical protein Tchar_00316 [Tepidimonas charontis]